MLVIVNKQARCKHLPDKNCCVCNVGHGVARFLLFLTTVCLSMSLVKNVFGNFWLQSYHAHTFSYISPISSSRDKMIISTAWAGMTRWHLLFVMMLVYLISRAYRNTWANVYQGSRRRRRLHTRRIRVTYDLEICYFWQRRVLERCLDYK